MISELFLSDFWVITECAQSVLIIWEKALQEVQLSQREASNIDGIWLLSVLLVGCLQQDEVDPAHQVQGVKQCQVRGGATDLPPLLAGQF